jgi:FkbM family methyltransferase
MASETRGRHTQLPAVCYSSIWSRFLYAYYHAGDHPAKLRVLRLLEQCTGNCRIIAPTRLGFVMALDRADFVQRTIFTEGEYEREVGDLLRNNLISSDVFYDVGAHVGYYTCMALSHGVRMVCAFEPDPLTSSVLRLNLRLNGLLDDRCHLYEVAVGATSSSKPFYRSHVSNTGMSGLSNRNSVDSFEVDVRTLDSIALDGKSAPPSVIKIDVEGFEFDVLSGGRRLLDAARPRLIIFEGPPKLVTCSPERSSAALLRCHGYRIEHIPRRSGVVEDVENYVALREPR